MKIHYTQSIAQTIRLEIHKAKVENREIDFIELSEHEYIQLLEEIGPIGAICHRDAFTKKRSIYGVHLKVLS